MSFWSLSRSLSTDDYIQIPTRQNSFRVKGNHLCRNVHFNHFCGRGVFEKKIRNALPAESSPKHWSLSKIHFLTIPSTSFWNLLKSHFMNTILRTIFLLACKLGISCWCIWLWKILFVSYIFRAYLMVNFQREINLELLSTVLLAQLIQLMIINHQLCAYHDGH